MEHRQDLSLFQVRDKLAAIVVIPQLDVEHMRVMHALCRDGRQLDTAFARQRGQRIVIGLPQGQTLLVNAICRFQLRPQVRRLQIRHQVAGADITPGIFIYLPAEELATVGAFLADDLRALHQGAIVNQGRAAFTACGVVFGFVEAKAANMTDGAQGAAFIG